MSKLYDRASGLISAEGIAVLAGVSTDTVLALPGVTDNSVPSTVLPETFVKRMNLNISRALAGGVGSGGDIYAILDWLQQEAA
ncbi:hypothetical protein JS562_53780 [Agrobacterium sp. S2]|nr:hypothetical protein [Agrobacterium sp. S2]